MLKIARAFCTMGPINRDPAFRLFVDECSAAVAGTGSSRTNIEKTLAMFEEENTVPFIARYRRDQTGDIEVSGLYELLRRWNDFNGMVKLRSSRLAALDAAGRVDEDIRKAFYECVSKEELDDLYATVKETKTAKSEIIKAFCVESISTELLTGKLKFAVVPPEATDAAHSTKYSVLDAVAYHCTSLIASELDIKEQAKLQFTRHPTVVTTALTPAYKALAKSLTDSKSSVHSKSSESAGTAKLAKTAKGESAAKASELTKYKDYHSVNRRLTLLAAHQLLAIRRGKEAGVISITLSPDDVAKQNILRFIHNKYRFFPNPHQEHAAQRSHGGNKVFREDVLSIACKDTLAKLCASLTKKQWKDAITSAEVEAAVVFGTSLRPLLLTAPLREVISVTTPSSVAQAPVVVLAVDPGFAHGHKWVVLCQGGGATGAKSESSGVPAQGEATSILCYGKIFENSHGHSGGGGGSTNNSSTAFNRSPVMLHSPSQLGELLRELRVQVVAIGNGTGSREAQQLVGAAMDYVRQNFASKKAVSLTAPPESFVGASQSKISHKRKHNEEADTATASVASVPIPAGDCVGYVVVSEAGASVYSASERAREEFPPAVLDISYVGAVSIGRRLMDPLSELVKIQPSSLGVGMYQHDLSDKGIAERLRDVVEDCVNVVGVDVNSASADLLRYISGLTEGNVKEIIAHRTGADAAAAASNSAGKPSKSKTRKNSATQECANIGRINSLAELRAIKGIGPKTFRNCAGFLRVYGGPEPLDATNIHPEDYELARVMTKVYTRERQQKVKLAIMTENTGHDERKHKKAKKEAQEETVAMQLSSRHNSAETAAEASETVSFWARFSAESKTTAGESAKPASASSSELALLQGKSAAELEQIWAWLVEGGIVAEEPPTVTVSSTPGRGSGGSGGRGGQPYMSYPKVLQEVPRDFHATVAVGSVLKGVIRNVTTFGAFVDLGGVVIASPESSSSSSSSGAAREKAQGGKGKASCDGLLHCSKYRDFLNKRTAGQAQAGAASAEIYVGREVMVKIISIEETSDGQKASHDKRRISLDLVELL